jgi:hypothetical protein
MEFEPIEIDPKVTRRNQRIERVLNRVVRGADRTRGHLRVGGRKADYDDSAYEFVGGAADDLRRKHYDKSLRLLWKAETHIPWSNFSDSSKEEKQLQEMANKVLSPEERVQLKRMSTADYKTMLDREYTPEQQQAIVNILSLIGHGEAYAWLVSTEVLNEVKSTGARAALTMQVLEEAKHFVVLRELLLAFDRPIPRMNVYEYILLERTFKSKGLEKFFGMNVVVEGFALSLFGMMSELPGLEVLRLFHLDESRHTALPHNYFQEFPMSWWQKHNPRAQAHRLSLVLPAIPILTMVENDLAVLGIDSFDFGGSMSRKILHLSERVGFHIVLPRGEFENLLNWIFNSYCSATRPDHVEKAYLSSETTVGRPELDVEAKVFGPGAVDAASVAAESASAA